MTRVTSEENCKGTTNPSHNVKNENNNLKIDYFSTVNTQELTNSENSTKIVPKNNGILSFRYLIDVFIQKLGIWKEAAVVSETSKFVLVHILFENTTYTVNKHNGKLPNFLATYGTYAFTGSNHKVLRPGMKIDVKFSDKWMTKKIIEVNHLGKRVKIESDSKDLEWYPFCNIFPENHKTLEDHKDHIHRKKLIAQKRGTDNSLSNLLRSIRLQLPKTEKITSYRQKLLKLGFNLKIIAGDGNCLFRAVSHQIYGTAKYHSLVRSTCIDFLEINKKRFAPFVACSLEDYDLYLKEKRKTGVWGDHVELHALCEIYERPLYVFSEKYDTKSVKLLETLNADFFPFNVPFFLSFRNEHYNSLVVDFSIEPEQVKDITWLDFLKLSKARKLISKNGEHVKCPIPGKIERMSKTKTFKSGKRKVVSENKQEGNDLQLAIELSKTDFKRRRLPSTGVSSNSTRTLESPNISQNNLENELATSVDVDFQKALAASFHVK